MLLLRLATVIFILFQTSKSAGQNQPPDISGSWQGEIISQAITAYYEIYLVKVGRNSYSGIQYFKWRNKGDNRSYDDPATRKIKKIIIGKFDGEFFLFNEIDTIQTVPGPGFAINKNQKLKFASNGRDMELSYDAGPSNNIHAKRISTEVPEDYARNIIRNSTIEVKGFTYNNPDITNTIKYNSTGHLNLTLYNQAGIDLRNLAISLRTAEQPNGIIGFDNMKGIIGLKKKGSESFSMLFPTGFSMPADSLHLILSVSLDSVVVGTACLSLATDPFMKTSKVILPEYGSPRMKAIAGYYGFSNTPYAEVGKPLEALVASGDKTAAMWKALFLYMGYGAYKIDESLGWSLAKNNLDKTESDARRGDAESLYLLYYACQMGLMGEQSMNGAEGLLKMSADAGFKPAVYDYALHCYIKRDFRTCHDLLLKSYGMGTRKAAEIIGLMYENGFGIEKDIASAKEWYTKGVEFGDPDAMLKLAILYSKGEELEPDINKALELANKAALKNCRGAMLFLGNIFFEGKQGKAINVPVAVKWFRTAEELGDREAMLALGAIYMQDNLPGLVKDEKTGYFWIRKAAELGEPRAMKLLAKIYMEGVITEMNPVKSRYWYNQAVLRGAATGQNSNTNMEDFLNIWKYADFSPSYVYVNRYGDVVGDSGPDFLGGLFGGLINSYFDSRMRSQQIINGLEFIYEKKGKKIYGGTITSRFASTLNLKKGQTVHIQSYGAVTLGFMLSGISADGIGDPMYAGYSIVPGIRHGAVLAGMDTNWQFIGRNGFYTATHDGMLNLAVNDADYSNNQGYFDLVIEITAN